MPAAYHYADLPALVERAAAGDSGAWNALVERFTGLLWGIARAHRLDQADAADVVQTTWLRLVEHLDRIEDPQRLPGWLSATVRHECLAVLRRGRREQPATVEQTLDLRPADGPRLDDALLQDERDVLLWRLFADLPERCRRLLRVLLSDPAPAYADVSAALAMPIGSIGPTRARCLSALRSLADSAGVTEVLRA